MTKDYKYLKDINFPSDIKKLSEINLQELSDEVRKEMIDAVDRIVWDHDLISSNESESESEDFVENELEDIELLPEDILSEEQQNNYEEFKRTISRTNFRTWKKS